MSYPFKPSKVIKLLADSESSMKTTTSQIITSISKFADIKTRLEKKKSATSLYLSGKSIDNFSSPNFMSERTNKRSKRTGVIGTSNGLIMTPHIPPLNLSSLFSPAELAEVIKSNSPILSSIVRLNGPSTTTKNDTQIMKDTNVIPPSQSCSAYSQSSEYSQNNDTSDNSKKETAIAGRSLYSISTTTASTLSTERSYSAYLSRPMLKRKLEGNRHLQAVESSASTITGLSTESSAKSSSFLLLDRVPKLDASKTSKISLSSGEYTHTEYDIEANYITLCI